MTLTSFGAAQTAALEFSFSFSADITSVSVTTPVANKFVTCAGVTCLVWGSDAATIADGTVAVATFHIAAAPVQTTIPVQITGVVGASPLAAGVSATGTTTSITLPQAPAVAPSNLSCSPTVFYTPTSSTCVLTLTSSAPAGGFTVPLSSSNASLTVPASVVVPVGNSSIQFSATAAQVTSGAGAIVTAGTGVSARSASFTLDPPLLLRSLVCSATTLSANSGTMCTISFNQAVLSNTTVSLSSSNAALTTPGSLVVFAGLNSGAFQVTTGAFTTSAASLNAVMSGQTLSISITLQAGISPATSLRFVPVTPCRIVDTRDPNGVLGGPSIPGSGSRDFPVPLSNCGIPANAAAYSLNMTAVPLGPLGYLSVWPTGQSQPGVSTLNSSDGRIKANAAIVPAGTSGAVTVYASNATNVIVDINGYFISDLSGTALAFYPLTPCRIADTRLGTGALAGPALLPNQGRDFPVLSSSCGVPANARAYALNLTVVPYGPLGFLSMWQSGISQPPVSTLNAPTGTVTANAAIMQAGTNGDVRVISTSKTELIIDINGYFAPPGQPGALSFYPLTPCRILDTRGATGPFAGPILATAQTRDIPVASSPCAVPTLAKAYSLNATVVPPTPLGFLSLWNTGGAQPDVSTLNAGDGSIVANAAIVPAGAGGSVSASASNAVHLILDINGYFAP